MAKAAAERKTEKKRGDNALFRYLRETWFELRKVSWPTRSEAINLTGIVVVVTAVLAIILGVIMDSLFEWLFSLLL